MTVEEVLAQVDELKPNQYSDMIKVDWLSRLDRKIWEEVITQYEIEEPITEVEKTEETDDTDNANNMINGAMLLDDNVPDIPNIPDHDDEEIEEENKTFDVFNGYTVEDMNTELLVCDSYADLYVDYVFAMIDYVNQELDRYSNSMMMFNEKYKDFKNYYNRTHKHKSGAYKIW